MKIFSNKQVVSRFHVIAFLFTLLGVAIILKAAYVMFFQRDFWQAVSERYVKENVEVMPTRGNIFSADGQLLATSLPEYKIYMDYMVTEKDVKRQTRMQRERDSLLQNKMDSICIGLNRILPGESVGWYRERLQKGRERRSKHWQIYPSRISFIDYKEVKSLPFFNKGNIRSGFHVEEFNECKKPFGSLASRTIGDLYPGKDSARSGLQLAYDTLLRGKPGFVHKQKVRNKWLPIVDVPPVNGADIITTIDVKMQDFCEKAILDELKEINAIEGTVILMEVKTGDIKAMVNMTRCEDGEYREVRNQAVSNLMEPGSVFKPMSFLVAFDDGKISMTETVDACHGIKQMYGRKMKDHNWRKGGYQILTIPECLEFSSNVGVSTVIDRIYHSHPEKFVNGLYRLGVAEDLHLDIPGYTPPRIRRPKKDGSNWSNTALAWMSIGYESQVPPISVLNFYNGVANGGCMMRPRLVTAAMRNGEVIREYPTQVVRQRMCSSQALKNIQTCLRWVVSRGLGKRAGSKNFSVSGKTGTAQVWGKGGFSLDYLVSFAGYYPSEDPRYSCIVCIKEHGGLASGGRQCGPVFKEIAEMAMANTIKPNLVNSVDTLHSLTPEVTCGNLLYANKVLEDLNISTTVNWAETDENKTIWGRAVAAQRRVELQAQNLDIKRVPDVTGMGARDALYLLEKLGMRVKLRGLGKVVQQSLPQGHIVIKGELIQLLLQSNDLSDLMPFVVNNEETTSGGETVPESEKATSADGTPKATSDSTKKSVKSTEKPSKSKDKKSEEKTTNTTAKKTSQDKEEKSKEQEKKSDEKKKSSNKEKSKSEVKASNQTTKASTSSKKETTKKSSQDTHKSSNSEKTTKKE
jgi:cell division protein FtsI (penicillin-binding protein 3)